MQLHCVSPRWMAGLFWAATALSSSAASLSGGSSPIADALQPFVDRQILAGAVTLVATADQVTRLEAIGFSDLEARKRMPPDALFWIASLSKPITATALMILVDERRVDLDAPVERYLPEFRGQMVLVEKSSEQWLLRKPLQAMKVRDLLSHTSGLPFRSPLEEPTLDLLPLRHLVRAYALGPLDFEPGTRFQYSNAGINTAARIVEVVSEQPYEQFVEQRLFKPLGMKDTTFCPTARQERRLARSYRVNADQTGLEETYISQLSYPLSDRQRQPFPAGGLFSTAQDIARFCRMILQGGALEGKRYLSSSSVAQMTRRQTGDLVQEGYGLGWSLRGGSYGHSGAYATSMNIDPDRGLITILLAQHAGFVGQEGAALERAFTQAVTEMFSR